MSIQFSRQKYRLTMQKPTTVYYIETRKNTKSILQLSTKPFLLDSKCIKNKNSQAFNLLFIYIYT